ncbi:hypothetical protein DNTS_018635 [Danionella cerebrum]|uniref:Uncharacterized protein n=1 Tax=Danionella cerebrum TaxID=2873325 RepID=A0A553RGL2_9TELE|nr:hypothetical protein DNTS_018635 [Danionella translucida]
MQMRRLLEELGGGLEPWALGFICCQLNLCCTLSLAPFRRNQNTSQIDISFKRQLITETCPGPQLTNDLSLTSSQLFPAGMKPSSCSSLRTKQETIGDISLASISWRREGSDGETRSLWK